MCLQLLLRKKAAEELKKEQERKAAERRRIIEERCGKPKNVDDANEGTLLLDTKSYRKPPNRVYIAFYAFTFEQSNFSFTKQFSGRAKL